MEVKTNPETIGLRIKRLREKNSESQKDLSEILQCKQNNISKIEQGKSQTLENLIAIAEHYDVSLDYLCKGEGGIDLLDTLDKYIHYRLTPISEIADDKKNHLIPHIEINNSLYNCLRQIELANKNSDMPQKIKTSWINDAKSEFNNTIISDNYRDYTSFILLEKTILEENQDIIKHIEKHIV